MAPASCAAAAESGCVVAGTDGSTGEKAPTEPPLTLISLVNLPSKAPEAAAQAAASAMIGRLALSSRIPRGSKFQVTSRLLHRSATRGVVTALTACRQRVQANKPSVARRRASASVPLAAGMLRTGKAASRRGETGTRPAGAGHERSQGSARPIPAINLICHHVTASTERRTSVFIQGAEHVRAKVTATWAEPTARVQDDDYSALAEGKNAPSVEHPRFRTLSSTPSRNGGPPLSFVTSVEGVYSSDDWAAGCNGAVIRPAIWGSGRMNKGGPLMGAGISRREELTTEPLAQARVLVVDDNEPLLRVFVRTLEEAGFEVHSAESGLQAAELLARSTFQVVVSDVEMPGMNGLALLRMVREKDLDIPVILVTGQPDVESAAQAVQYGACDYITKPVQSAELKQVVQRAVGLGRLARLKRDAMEVMESGKFLIGDRAGLEVAFARAIQGLWIAYQPIVDAASRSLYGYEALLRTTEPSIPHAGAFLDAAESLGRLDELGRAVRAKAPVPVADLKPGVALFINLHARDLEDKTLTWPSTPLARLAKGVVLEITERASLDHVKDLQTKVAQLREMGFRIAIDDLGAGYAGLTSFAMLEPEFVKIDMSLVRNIHRSQTKRKLIRSMTTLCKDMGMCVVAEGVETVEERDVLVEMGCDLLQGYLLAKPGRPFPEFTW
jgi:EAL domain-containing protein (putative c-di-GMP-specific phosphodiesterase class I)